VRAFAVLEFHMAAPAVQSGGMVAALPYLPLRPRLNGWLCDSGFMKIPLVLGLAFIPLLLLLILMFVGFALL
jgi:hypothetical protein